jgi:anti-sigma regulatory factor (Ser/Thr protein kinase)
LWEWRLTLLSDRAELLVSELLTNAVKAARAMNWLSPVRLWLLSDGQRVLILVWDNNPRPPMRVEPTEEAEDGRGLLLVAALCANWNWYVPEAGSGKIVWAEVTEP